MGNLGMPEIMMILVIALIIFGPRKLPEIGKTLGQSLAHFRKASEDFKRQWEEEVEIEKRKIEAAPAAETSHYAAAASQEPATPDYSSPPVTEHAAGHDIYAPVPSVDPGIASVPRSESGAKSSKTDWM